MSYPSLKLSSKIQGQAKKMGGLGSETLNSKAMLLIFLSLTELLKIVIGV